jgi:hypothetical protein
VSESEPAYPEADVVALIANHQQVLLEKVEPVARHPALELSAHVVRIAELIRRCKTFAQHS